MNTFQLGYATHWHDLIDIAVPIGKVPHVLLTPRVPTPLHFQNPRNILSKIDSNWWNRTRNKVYSVQDYHCACCGTHKAYQKGYNKTLDAHEVYNIDYETGTVTLACIVPLCKYCHNAIHFGRLHAKLEAGDLSEREYYAILGHANMIIAEAGLPEKDWDHEKDDNIYNIAWEAWHLDLEIDNVKQSYYSLYANEEELKRNYE